MVTVASSPSETAGSLKPSRYLIVSDRRYRNGSGSVMRLALSTRTGTLVALPDDVGVALEDGIVPPMNPELEAKLEQAEMLVPLGERELESLLGRNRTAAQTSGDRIFVLLPASYCNMGCSYCGQEHFRGGLREPHREAILRRIEAAMDQPQTRLIDIRWFGGEPMLAYGVILAMGERLVSGADARGLDYRSNMITNGSLLTVKKLLALRDVARVRRYSITLDGPKRIHDVRRPLKSGGSSYDHITGVIGEAVRHEGLEDVVFEIRTNVDLANADIVEELLVDCSERGLGHERIYFSIMPIHTWSADVDMSAQIVQWREFAEREIGWLELLSRLGLRFPYLPREAVPVVCEAVRRTDEIISSTGRIFSCTEKPLVPLAELREGLAQVSELDPDEPRPLGPYDDWNDRVERGETPCRDCRIFGVCGGACPKLWMEGQVPCPTYKLPANMQRRLDFAAAAAHLRPVESA